MDALQFVLTLNFDHHHHHCIFFCNPITHLDDRAPKKQLRRHSDSINAFRCFTFLCKRGFFLSMFRWSYPKHLVSACSLSLNLKQAVVSVRSKRSEVMKDFETIFGISLTVALVCWFWCFVYVVRYCDLKFHIFPVKPRSAKKIFPCYFSNLYFFVGIKCWDPTFWQFH